MKSAVSLFAERGSATRSNAASQNALEITWKRLGVWALLRVADPRSEGKSTHCHEVRRLALSYCTERRSRTRLEGAYFETSRVGDRRSNSKSGRCPAVANFPEYRNLAECEKLVKEVAHELKIKSPFDPD